MGRLWARYAEQGLTPPIALRPGWKAWALGLVIAPAMTLLSLAIGLFGGFPVALIGLFGGAFFGFAALLIGIALGRGARRGLARLSPEGLYLAQLGLTLPWEDIGPAYAQETRRPGGRTVDVMVAVRNLAAHRDRADRLGRLQIWIALSAGRAPREGLLARGVRAAARPRSAAEADATLYPIPGAFVSAGDAEDLARILTAEGARARAEGSSEGGRA